MKIKSIKIMLAGLLAVPMLALGAGLFTISVGAQTPTSTPSAGLLEGAKAAKGDATPSNLFSGSNSIWKNITNTALFAIGAISVLMLIYGGIRYTISGGDEKAVTAAKNTILYAVVGIVVALLAYAIVNFVVTSLVK